MTLQWGEIVQLRLRRFADILVYSQKLALMFIRMINHIISHTRHGLCVGDAKSVEDLAGGLQCNGH